MKLKKVLVALGFAFGSLTLIAPTPSKAEGGCPNGFYPIGGGYCRNIVCKPGYLGSGFGDQDAIATLQKYGQSCNPKSELEILSLAQRGGGWPITVWGNQTLPMR